MSVFSDLRRFISSRRPASLARRPSTAVRASEAPPIVQAAASGFSAAAPAPVPEGVAAAGEVAGVALPGVSGGSAARCLRCTAGGEPRGVAFVGMDGVGAGDGLVVSGVAAGRVVSGAAPDQGASGGPMISPGRTASTGRSAACHLLAESTAVGSCRVSGCSSRRSGRLAVSGAELQLPRLPTRARRRRSICLAIRWRLASFAAASSSSSKKLIEKTAAGLGVAEPEGSGGCSPGLGGSGRLVTSGGTGSAAAGGLGVSSAGPGSTAVHRRRSEEFSSSTAAASGGGTSSASGASGAIGPGGDVGCGGDFIACGPADARVASASSGSACTFAGVGAAVSRVGESSSCGMAARRASAACTAAPCIAGEEPAAEAADACVSTAASPGAWVATTTLPTAVDAPLSSGPLPGPRGEGRGAKELARPWPSAKREGAWTPSFARLLSSCQSQDISSLASRS
mmetsp:Transcript_102702/g.306784  ORF Transcript_102702/g.306784 Transcript_102702/m.306784 type:complete len:455 (-) Transcript_102702:773-2137(-)